MAIDPAADEDTGTPESLLQLSSASSSPAPSPVPSPGLEVVGSVDRYNVNVIARDKVDEILRQAVEETVSAATSYEGEGDEEEGNSENSVMEDNYNNLLVRCDEKVFCADKDIHVSRMDTEGFPGNSLESLDGNNEQGEEDEDEGEEGQVLEVNPESCGNVLSINETTSAPIPTTNNYTSYMGEDVNVEEAGEVNVTHLSNNELNRDQIDASTGGNYLSRHSVDTFSDKSNKEQDGSHPLRTTIGYNVIKDADGNSVTDVKGLVGAASPELIQMTPDILIKNISVTAEMGGIVSLSGTATTTTHATHFNSQFLQDGKQRMSAIVKCDSFAPDLLRNIETAEEESSKEPDQMQLQLRRQQRRHRQARGEHLHQSGTSSSWDGSDLEDNNKLLSVSLVGSNKNNITTEDDCKQNVEGGGGNFTADHRNLCHGEQVLVSEGNSISTTSNAAVAPGTTTTGDILMEQRGGSNHCSNLLPHEVSGQRQHQSSDTLGAETNNLNNNGIFRRSYTWDQEQQALEHHQRRDAALLSDVGMTPRNADLRDVMPGTEEDKESNLDFVEGSRRCPSSDVMVAMFNGTLWNSSPIDIVGDFEGEIERELGLITRSMSSNYGAARAPPVAVVST